MKRLIVILLILLFHNLSAQQKITGCIMDVGNNQPVPYVNIQALPSNISTLSDENGQFSISLLIDEDLSNDNIYVLGHSIFWNSDQIEWVQIYDIKSSLVFQKKVIGDKSCDLPPLRTAYYLLSITYSTGRNNYLLFSNGKSISIREKTNLNSVIKPPDTSLMISDANYYSLLQSLSDFNNGDTIYSLKTHYDSLTHFNRLISYQAYNMLSTTPSVTNYSNVREIKVIHNLISDEIYYINIKEHRSHYAFAKNHLGYELGPYDFLYSQYSNNPSRYLNLITISYHETIDKYILEFSSVDQIDCDGIKRTFDKVLNTSYLGSKLYFYCNNLKWENCHDIPQITSEEIYFGQSYQALNNEENYGYLTKIDIEQLQNTYLGRHDIVILNGIPNDLPVVAGIITTDFQTPLSHINILSHNRNTPNMALKDALTDADLNSLMEKLVYLKVESDTFIIRQASIEEAEAFWNIREPQDTINLQLDTISSGLVELESENIHSVNKIGGKAANFAELVSLDSIPLPEDYFAIPFYYYWQHMKENGIDIFVEEMLAEAKFYSNHEYRKMKLIQLQNIIKTSPLNENLSELVENRLDHFSRFSSYRFRSSTNAEDLEGFNGAGLYSSTSAKKDDPDKAISKAIKKVWASLWDIRAFEERDYYKINHHTVAMGVLVHRSFPDEDANGVVITSNLYNVNHGYTVNCQYKDYSIVYPEPGILNDLIIIRTISLDGNPYNIEYLTRSNMPELNGGTVLNDDELYELGDYCTLIKNYYFNYIADDTSCGYESFSVDIEFKIDSSVSPRKLYIKQARIYKAYY